jgi:general stress protein 26
MCIPKQGNLTNLQTRVYYFTNEVKVQERWNSKEHHWYEPGSTLGDVAPGSVALYAQVETL